MEHTPTPLKGYRNTFLSRAFEDGSGADNKLEDSDDTLFSSNSPSSCEEKYIELHLQFTMNTEDGCLILDKN